MCIIISKPAEKKLPKSIYEECFRSNKDGAGIAYIEDGNIVLKKGFFNFEEFYKAIAEKEDHGMLIHCRIATHGVVGKDNCHPFTFTSSDKKYQWVMAHNGTLDWRSTKEMSDTACFAEDLLWPMVDHVPDVFDKPFGDEIMDKMLGARNKMVVVRYELAKNEYTTYIFNETAGNRHNGCWFSNMSWKPYRASTTGYGYGYGSNVQYGMGGAYDDGDFYGHKDEDNSISVYGWRKNKHGIWINDKDKKAQFDGQFHDISKVTNIDNADELDILKANGDDANDSPSNEPKDKSSKPKLEPMSSDRKSLIRRGFIHVRTTGQLSRDLKSEDRVAIMRKDFREHFPEKFANASGIEACDTIILGMSEDTFTSSCLRIADNRKAAKREEERAASAT